MFIFPESSHEYQPAGLLVLALLSAAKESVNVELSSSFSSTILSAAVFDGVDSEV